MADAQGFVSGASTASEAASTVPLNSGATSASATSTGAASSTGIAGEVVQLFKRSSHPTAALFHVLFKGGALVFYLLGGIFTQSFVLTFVICIILMACDFWTVKNVTGRLMVGLRWWNDVAEDGTATWRYESIDDHSQVSRADYAIFWYSMYLAAFLWGLFAFLGLIRLSADATLISTVSFVLVWSNIYGFWNCSSERARVEQSVQSAITQGTVAALTGKFSFGGFGAAPGSATSARSGDMV